tara:strand:+ start:289 stop:483 length:195 start_codon:yes stop_codon:yes gene_type:complete
MKKYTYKSDINNEHQIITSRISKKEALMIQQMIEVWETENPTCINDKAIDMERLYQKMEIRINN